MENRDTITTAIIDRGRAGVPSALRWMLRCAILSLALSLGVTGCSTQEKAALVRHDKTTGANPARAEAGGAQAVSADAQDPNTLPPSHPKVEHPIRAALLVPLTGPQAEMGRALSDAASLALPLTDAVELLIYDTGSNKQHAIAAVDAALHDQAAVILGPLFASTTQEVANIAKEKQIPVISFTNNRKITQPHVLSFGFQPEEQIERVMAFAGNRGITEFFALLPANEYGKLAEAAIRKETDVLGGVLIKIEFYTDSADSKKIAAESIYAALKTNIHDTDEAMARGLILIEGGHTIAELMGLLDIASLPKDAVRLLGSGQWDDLATQSIPSMKGAWFASASPNKHQHFTEMFKERYHYQPPWIASLAFDAVGLVQAVAQTKQDMPHPTVTATELFQTQGFVGVDGIFRFHPAGYTERGLAIIEVTQDGFVEVDPAPERF